MVLITSFWWLIKTTNLMFIIQTHLCSQLPLQNHSHTLNPNQRHHNQPNNPNLTPQGQAYPRRPKSASPQPHQYVCSQPHGFFNPRNLVKEKKRMREKNLNPLRLTIRSCCRKISTIDIKSLYFIILIFFKHMSCHHNRNPHGSEK